MKTEAISTYTKNELTLATVVMLVAHASYRLRSSAALVPPNPNELESA